GAFIGLTTRHTRGHMTRAVLEGVAFGLKDSFTLIDNVGLPEKFEVRISGGGAKSPIWQQIIADIFNAPLVNVNTPEAGAFGAALLAASGTGARESVEAACAAAISAGVSVAPSDNVAAYPVHYGRYREIYAAVKVWFL